MKWAFQLTGLTRLWFRWPVWSWKLFSEHSEHYSRQLQTLECCCLLLFVGAMCSNAPLLPSLAKGSWPMNLGWSKSLVLTIHCTVKNWHMNIGLLDANIHYKSDNKGSMSVVLLLFMVGVRFMTCYDRLATFALTCIVFNITHTVEQSVLDI